MKILVYHLDLPDRTKVGGVYHGSEKELAEDKAMELADEFPGCKIKVLICHTGKGDHMEILNLTEVCI